MVRCQPGFDGGLRQRFVMEVYDRHAQSLAGNVTSDRPAFTVGNLQSGLGFDISVYAYNVRGPSDPVQLHAYTLKSAEKRTGKIDHEDDACTEMLCGSSSSSVRVSSSAVRLTKVFENCTRNTVYSDVCRY